MKNSKTYFQPQNVNNAKDNIRHFRFPLGLLSGGSMNKRRMVIFLGADIRNVPNINLKEFVHISNQCLNYIRRECAGFDLYYKPHPAETDEYTMLNLEGFTIMERMPVELLYMRHAQQILHVFSLCSTASFQTREFGFNTYLFLELATPAFDSRVAEGYRKTFSALPRGCFINNLNQAPYENKKTADTSGELEEQIRQLINGRHGITWMLIGDPSSLPYAKVIDLLIKKRNPDMTMHLVVSWHHRWETMPMDEVKQLFHSVSFIPRPFYSLRPKKLLRAWHTARQIRAWPIGKDDVIISRLGLAFTDDCFASYFPNIPRVALMNKDFFDLACEEQKLSVERYAPRLGAKLFNLILEPLLGIERTQYFEDKRRIANIYRYVRPINDIFDEVWVY